MNSTTTSDTTTTCDRCHEGADYLYRVGEQSVCGCCHMTAERETLKRIIATFPTTFGLRGFPGKTFQISETASYWTGGSRSTLMLYTAIREGDKWSAFAKGTEQELRSQICADPNAPAPKPTKGSPVKAVVRDLVFCILENQSESYADGGAYATIPSRSSLLDELRCHLDTWSEYAPGLERFAWLARKIAAKTLDEVLATDEAALVAEYRPTILPALRLATGRAVAAEKRACYCGAETANPAASTERGRQELAAKGSTTAREFEYLCADGEIFRAVAATEAGAFRVLNAERPGMLAELIEPKSAAEVIEEVETMQAPEHEETAAEKTLRAIDHTPNCNPLACDCPSVGEHLADLIEGIDAPAPPWLSARAAKSDAKRAVRQYCRKHYLPVPAVAITLPRGRSRIDEPTFADVRKGLPTGIYPARRLNPPSGDDCTHLLVRDDGSLGWCNKSGEQWEDFNGQPSRFTVANLCDEE